MDGLLNKDPNSTEVTKGEQVKEIVFGRNMNL